MAGAKRKLKAIVPVLMAGIFLSGCAQQGSAPAGGPAGSWVDMPLFDVNTQQEFRISDFEGKPVLLESFAVWCSTCLVQQKEIKKLKTSHGDAIVHVSINTDPNEDESKVKGHFEKHGFEWYFAVAPIEFTQALMDDFGLTVVNAPMAPVILICENRSARLLRNGIKPADELLSEVQKGCL